MTYHPIYGITIFVLFVLFAFLLGKKLAPIKYKRNIDCLKNKKINADSISPDAHWLKNKKN